MYFLFKKIFNNLCPKENVLKIIEMITIHCCLTLNMSSHVMTSPSYNNNLISILRLWNPCASHPGNAVLMQKSWLQTALFMGVWVGETGTERGFKPPTLDLKIPRDLWTAGRRENRYSGPTLCPSRHRAMARSVGFFVPRSSQTPHGNVPSAPT